MAVAKIGAWESHTGTTGSASEASFSFTATGAGSPKGVQVAVVTFADTSDLTSSVTYGGMAMTRVGSGAATDTAGEPGRIDLFHLGSGIPTGDQSIVVNRTNNATVMYAMAVAQSAAIDTAIAGLGTISEDSTFDEVNVDDGSPGTNSVRYFAYYTGANSIHGPGSNSSRDLTIDIGNYVAGLFSEITAGQGSRPVGPTTAAIDDCAAVYWAVKESSGSSAIINKLSGPFGGPFIKLIG